MAIRLSSQEDALEETHEINVTPFIDVMLVLLIVFMVAAPLSAVDVNVDLGQDAVSDFTIMIFGHGNTLVKSADISF
jgi:biopolymer transport protein ExbD